MSNYVFNPKRLYQVDKMYGGEKKTEWVWCAICPICGNENIHILGTEKKNGNDNYEAWDGRGDCLKNYFEGECGHKFCVNYGFHKGITFVWFSDEKQAENENQNIVDEILEEVRWFKYSVSSEKSDGFDLGKLFELIEKLKG